MPDASVARAHDNIQQAAERAAQGGGFKTALTRLYQQIFRRSIGVPVSGLTFEGQQYLVEIGNNVPGKVISSAGLSAEKLALLDLLPQVVQNAEYVGSGEYVQHGERAKPVIRYDYFETPVNIGGSAYVARFDVEVIPGANNYRTHQISKIELQSEKSDAALNAGQATAEARLAEEMPVPSSASGGSLVGPAPTAAPGGPSLQVNSNITRGAENVNPGETGRTEINFHYAQLLSWQIFLLAIAKIPISRGVFADNITNCCQN